MSDRPPSRELGPAVGRTSPLPSLSMGSVVTNVGVGGTLTYSPTGLGAHEEKALASPPSYQQDASQLPRGAQGTRGAGTGAVDDEKSLALEVAALRDSLQQMQEAFRAQGATHQQQLQQLQREQQQQQRQQRAEQASRIVPPASVARLPQSLYSPAPAASPAQYASAALPVVPVILSRGRASMGVPTSSYAPATPAVQARDRDRRQEDSDEDREDGHQAGSAAAEPQPEDDVYAQLPRYSPAMERIRKAMTHTVKPFYGDSSKDKDTGNVVSWVEKVDTEFSIHMGEVQIGRLNIVRHLVAGSAMSWLNRRLDELAAEQRRPGAPVGDIEWATVKGEFINAHLGLNTIETFKAELRALRLGSEECPRPMELNRQFDRLAELAYPDRRLEGMQTVLGDEYKKIIAASRDDIGGQKGKNIVSDLLRQGTGSTLEQWKLAVGRYWASWDEIDSIDRALGYGRYAPQPQQSGQRGGGGQHKSGRGGGHNRGRYAARVNGASSSDTADGEDEQAEGQPQARLNAAGGNQRGGRGGGRGRARPNQPWREKTPAEMAEIICYRCDLPGHFSRDCPTRQQQGNAGAGQ